MKTYWMLSIGLLLAVALSCTKEGPMGPPGTTPPGNLEGKVVVWEDIHLNSGNATVDPSGVTVELEGTEFKATTEIDGSYRIEDVPAGVYTIVVFKDSSSADGYGTVRKYNVFIGGGTTYYSPKIARKTQPPTNLQTHVLTFGGQPGVVITWDPPDPNLSYRYIVWQSPDASFEHKEQVAAREDNVAFIPSYMLHEEETVYFAVMTDNDVTYVDQTTGDEVFPCRSALSEPSDLLQAPSGGPLANLFSVVTGVISVWEDFVSRAPDASGITVALEVTNLSTGASEITPYQATTDANGFYLIEDVPIGVYTILAMKEGYGTVRRYNFFVGQGVSYFSTDIGRRATPPTGVQIQQITEDGESRVQLSWASPDADSHRYIVWVSTDESFARAQRLTITLDDSVSIPAGVLPSGTVYFAVAADNGISYVNEATGREVFPTMSELSTSVHIDL